MNQTHYCYDVLLKYGSTLYYCLKKITPDKRDIVVAIEAFYQEILQAIFENRDQVVAYQKLLWWQNDVLKIPEKQSEHPVGQELQKYITDNDRLLKMVDGMMQTLNLPTFPTFEDLVLLMMQIVGQRECLMLDILQKHDHIPIEYIHEAALVLQLTQYIQQLRNYVRIGFIPFSVEEMQKFNVTAEMLGAYKTTPEIQQLLQYQMDKVERAHSHVINDLGMYEQTLALCKRAEIAWTTLQEIKAGGFKVLESYIHLTPLKMWWVAYR
ncbi:MAG TPA: squalene/phytoene synthase family protein [Gammaproteobacteria bacterium]|jgi:phytoene synthase|nr:squalene/phytoene synthase family protein [Gammaproteobacteria bacterium]